MAKREENMRNVFVALLMLAASPAVAQDKEKLSAIDLTVRTALTFKITDSAVQKLLPPGFELNSPTAGPSKGSNLNVTLIDYLMVQDPEGKPLPPRSTIAMGVPAKKTATGEAVTVVFGGFCGLNRSAAQLDRLGRLPLLAALILRNSP
jgi:hypothetical protein